MPPTETTKRKVKVPRRQKPVESPRAGPKHATCELCDETYTSEDWRQVAAWFSSHLQQKHPEAFGKLFGVSAAMLTWLLSQCYQTEPDWNEEEAMVVLQRELAEIVAGTRDPLVDGMS